MMTRRRKTAIRTGILAIAALAVGLLPVAAGSVRAQAASGWIALQIWSCPAGMTAETLDPWSCWVVSSEGVGAELWALDGTPLTGTWNAYFDGWTWTWDGLAVGTVEEPIPYQIVQTVPPPGAWGWTTQYAMAEGDGSIVWLSDYYPGADLHIYNFFP
jgi:hypothetical protein